MSLALAVFDVDGTLVDSQADIMASMEAAFAAIAEPPPPREAVLGIVGLSLPQAMAALLPGADPATVMRLTETYKDRYAALRAQGGAEASPLYPGIGDLLKRLSARDDLLLGIATGKSRRGLDALLDSLDLRRHFVTTQVADSHPSKPHPSMLTTALREAGVDEADAVMIGDTRFDLDMAQAAGVPFIGVGWGYHRRDRLAGAARLVDDAAALETAILDLLETRP